MRLRAPHELRALLPQARGGRFESRLEQVDEDLFECADAASLRERFANRPNAETDVPAMIRWAQGATFPEVVAAMPGFGGFGLLPFTFEAAP